MDLVLEDKMSFIIKANVRISLYHDIKSHWKKKCKIDIFSHSIGIFDGK